MPRRSRPRQQTGRPAVNVTVDTADPVYGSSVYRRPRIVTTRGIRSATVLYA